MLTGYPSASRPVSTASSNLASHLAASAHTAHLVHVDFLRWTREITGGPEPRPPWRDIDQDAHVVGPPHPPAEPRTPQRTRRLTDDQGFHERCQILIGRHVGDDAILCHSVALNQHSTRLGDATSRRFREQHAHLRITPDIERLLR